MDHTVAMARAITLSEKGLGKCAPNPIVGAVIIDKDGNVIGEGFHDRMNSKDHAEVVAINNAARRTKGATMVVTLEPCNHVGKTPACTQVIIDAGITTVVYAVSDPNSQASGGEAKLQSAGINVVSQVLSKEASYSNRAWLTKIAKKRPYFIWKVATTLDAKIAASDGSSKWISNEVSRTDVQRLRRESDAILVGTNTVVVDNPHLIPRGDFKGYTHNPIRVICGEQDLPKDSKVFDDAAQTVVVNSKDLNQLVAKLNELELNQVLVEAGPTLGSALMASGNIDELIIYQAPKLLGAGKEFVSRLGISTLDDHLELELLTVKAFGSDIKSHFIVKGR